MNSEKLNDENKNLNSIITEKENIHQNDIVAKEKELEILTGKYEQIQEELSSKTKQFDVKINDITNKTNQIETEKNEYQKNVDSLNE